MSFHPIKLRWWEPLVVLWWSLVFVGLTVAAALVGGAP